jgi:hypothetical protein
MTSVQSILPLVVIGASVALGLYLGFQFLQRRRNRPVLAAVYILPGLIALEAIALLLRGAPDRTFAPSPTPGQAAALLLVVALIVGLLTPMITRDRPRVVATLALTIHGLLATTAFLLLVVWLA